MHAIRSRQLTVMIRRRTGSVCQVYLCNHVIDEAVLIPDASLLILLPVALLIHVLEDLQEAAIIYLQDGVLCG